MAVIKRQHFGPGDDALGPAPKYATIGEIYRQAELRGIRTRPLDIEALISDHGIKISREEMDIDISGYIEPRATSFVIGVNKYQSPRRQRFTLAHEFAHYLFDREAISRGRHVDKILLRSEERSPVESRANDFAAKVLMPKDAFDMQVHRGITRFEDLAEIFDVSLAAVRYRAFKLKYINAY